MFIKIIILLHPHKMALTHGVMVALQILVLPVKVRILMGQLRALAIIKL
jgi:hypothetical protein